MKDEMIFENKLEEFIFDCVVSVGDEVFRKYFGFDLIRYSSDEPYWCILACEHSNDGIAFLGDDVVAVIGEPYIIPENVSIHEILSILIKDNFKVRIDSYYYKN